MATQNIYALTDTWNNVATTFTGIGLNVTDTTSASTSMLIDLQHNSTSLFHVLKSGVIHSKRSNYNITNANAAAILVSNYSLTGSNADSMFDLAGTWNTSGTPTAIKLNMTDTASASGSLLMDLQVGGSSQFSIRKDGAVVVSNSFNAYGSFAVTNAFNTVLWSGASFGWAAASGVNPTTVADLTLLRDAANTLAQRNSTNAQAFRVYNTYTDASNYERLGLAWSGNTLQILTERAGTGTSRDVQIGTQGTSSLYARTNNTDRWRFTENGHLFAHADNSYDIGASGATRRRNIYMASWIRMAVTTVASLPAAATAGAGARMMVSDALAPVFGSAVAGSGAVTVPVYSTGAAWNVG